MREEVLSRVLSPKDPVSDKPLMPGMALSMIAGCVIQNTRLSRWIGLRDTPREHPTSRLKWGEGLGLVEKTVLRSAVILLGFNIPPLFRGSNGTSTEYALAVACVIIPVNQFVAFLVVQGFTRLIGMDKVSRDLISLGTMNTGASAVFSYSTSFQSADAGGDGEGDECEAKARQGTKIIS